MKRNTLKLSGKVERVGSGKFVNVYETELRGPDKRGRPLGRLKDWVEEYLGERGVKGRGVLEEARRKCWDRERLTGAYLPWPFPKGMFLKGVRC